MIVIKMLLSYNQKLCSCLSQVVCFVCLFVWGGLKCLFVLLKANSWRNSDIMVEKSLPCVAIKISIGHQTET